MRYHYSLAFIFSFFCFITVSSQITLKGKVVEDPSGVPVFAANVLVEGASSGVTTDFDGEFDLVVKELPVTLVFSFIGFKSQKVVVSNSDELIKVGLVVNNVMLEEAEIVGERISEKQKQSPLTVESMDVIAIKEAPSGSFYEGLGNLKGVDLTSASLGFKVINTRGFNSTSPVRSLQLIDGVDNQSPGLNFSLGNFLGASDLDVKKVDIVAGASSAYFGPGAFNGVINMETKNPFDFPGVSFSMKMGERSMMETAFRFAEVIKNKDDEDVFAYKINFYNFRAKDWAAENYEPIYDSRVPASNPGRFDAVNIYGDEYFPANDFSSSAPWTYKGLGLFYRTGYKEADLVDYSIQNLKGNVSLHWRTQPEKTYESPELSWTTSLGNGNTVYQGDNRFSLRDILFIQNKLEYSKKNKFFIRAYATHEDAGRSYDPYNTALKMLEEARPDEDWAKVYVQYWNNEVSPKLNALGYPSIVWDPETSTASFDYAAWSQWMIDYQDTLVHYHSIVENLTNNGNAGIPAIDDVGYFEPGTDAFDESFNRITSLKSNEGEGGTRFYDRSALYHVHGEYIWEPSFIDKIVTGGNGRVYTPNSDGTIFSDTSGTRITNKEWGAYIGLEHKYLENRLIARATLRIDKNQNFNMIVTPAASLVFTPKKNNYIRASFSSALRNPTLADQYLFLDVGRAKLSGNLRGAEGLVTVESFNEYRNALDRSKLEYFDINPIQPEQVKTFELGYRTSIANNLFADASYYYSLYTNFIGYLIGIDVKFNDISLPEDLQVYRYAANSQNDVQTQGFSFGLNYYLNDLWEVTGNYSWNNLAKTNVDDPIIPAFNTPEHKFNLGANFRGKPNSSNGNKFGAGANYKWVQGFIFEGSPQFTGRVPGYDIVDAQANYFIEKINTTFKVGASNILNNLHIETYGGPKVGRLLYFSILFEINNK